MIVFDLNNEFKNKFFKLRKKQLFVYVNINIFDLEKKSDGFLYLLEDNKESFFLFNMLIKKFSFKELLINTKYPEKAEIFEQISFFKLRDDMKINVFIIELIKNIIKFGKNIFITIVLHELYKKQFLIESQIHNIIFLELMLNLNNEYKNKKKFIFNCISSNRFNFSYKNKIYPYKYTNIKQNSEDFYYLYKYIKKLNITNKLIK